MEEDTVRMASYPVMETFYSIQGEGLHQGKAAFFIRLGGCNVGCHWCDVKESWNADAHPKISIDSLIEEGKKYSSNMVIVTGGEPVMYNLVPLTNALQENQFKTHIETSGAYPISGTWDWICLSPKKFKQPISENLLKADELKIIIYNESDFKWGEDFAKQVSQKCKLFLQPEWGVASKVLPLIIEYVKKHPAWSISLQTHKHMDIL